MSGTGSYGQSFAMKLFAQDKLDAALAEAERAVERDPEDPEAMLDRAQVLLGMERHEAGVAALEAAIRLDAQAGVLDDMMVDDLLFSSLVAWAQKVAQADRTQALAVLDRYPVLLSKGRHGEEFATWRRRLSGEQRTSWTRMQA